MSLFNPYKPKKKYYPKEPISRMKSFDTSSKSTRATSKNFFTIPSQKLLEKLEYHDLYSDLASSRQTNENSIKKRYPKEDSEDFPNDSFYYLDKSSLKKNRKTNIKSVKVNIVKYFKEDGEAIGFPLFKESDININEFDNKVKIESAEDDYASDEGTLEYGRQKVEKDLIEAFSIIRKEKINCLINLKKYNKLFKKPKYKLNLLKKLPDVKCQNMK